MTYYELKRLERYIRLEGLAEIHIWIPFAQVRVFIVAL